MLYKMFMFILFNKLIILFRPQYVANPIHLLPSNSSTYDDKDFCDFDIPRSPPVNSLCFGISITQENACENVIYKMSSILATRLQCV